MERPRTCQRRKKQRGARIVEDQFPNFVVVSKVQDVNRPTVKGGEDHQKKI
jgi:hypothetical protein